jgi:thiol:disulfide interchange protein DsbD
MPCVFPILSLKAFSILQTAHESPPRVRWNGIVFTAGVLFSFVVIAAVLLMIRASGEAIGWGFQLQSPIFILLLTWLIFIMGLQFSGVWSFGESFMGRGQRLTAMPSSTGTFFTGVLAVIVATPCTAPFMGTALGYALTQSTSVAMMIFISLGVGMALPWLLISLFPALCRYLPRPGQWMNTAKQFMAFPLYATAAWLLWVLAQQVDGQSLLIALLSLVVIALALWLKQLTGSSKAFWKWVINGLVLLIIVSMTVFITQLKTDTDSSPQQQTTWQDYTPETLQQYRNQRTPVLINFTAAWCITCLVNEKLVLGTADIQAELKQQGVVYMKGDWTNRNPEITRVLEQHGRSGVPLYLLFPADPQAQAMVLPNILTRSIVEEYLARLSTN